MIQKFLLFFLVLSFPFVETARAVRIQSPSGDAGVLIGPCGSPAAIGPTGNDDDFTNLNVGDNAMRPAGDITGSPDSLIFKNTVQNTGDGDDAFILAAPSLPSGFRSEISLDNGDRYVSVDPWTSVTVAVSYRSAVTVYVRVTAPVGLANLSSFDIVIRATSTINPLLSNDTIDRIYTGFVRLDLTSIVTNRTGVGGPHDAVSGAEIEFVVSYANISSSDGFGCALLTAHNLVINEDGYSGLNNWGATTVHILGASDDRGGYIVGDREDSNSLSDVVMKLGAGESGTFKFKRKLR